MRRLKLFGALIAVFAALLLPGSPVAADTCGPKAVCTVYRTACAVAYQAGLQCVD